MDICFYVDKDAMRAVFIDNNLFNACDCATYDAMWDSLKPYLNKPLKNSNNAEEQLILLFYRVYDYIKEYTTEDNFETFCRKWSIGGKNDLAKLLFDETVTTFIAG